MAASIETTYLLHELVEMRAGDQPAAPAVSCGPHQLTYGELDRRADRLAGQLRSRGIGTEHVVALLTERQVTLPVAILGVLKAGAAYLPLTADLPTHRLIELIRDSGARVVVSCHRLRAVAEATGATVVLLDDPGVDDALDGGDVWDGGPGRAENANASPDTAAYVIYTSGSTGSPKGVLVPHGAAAAHIRSVIDRFDLRPADVVLQMANHAFDVAVEQLFAGLAAGARVVLRDDQMWGPVEVCQALREHQVTVADLPTAIFGELTTTRHAPALRAALGRLRTVLVGGEMLPATALDRWQEVVGVNGPPVYNAYGPTEAVMTATVYRAAGDIVASTADTSVPIGDVIGPRTLRVLDNDLRSVRGGESGELYIGGTALARGYLGRPDLTAERFVPDPHGTPGARMYRTGDRVRRAGTGPDLTFLGRIDDQVKVRGYRIEPGEIEAVLLRHPGIAQAAVVARSDRLAAYLVSLDAASRPGPSQMAAWLADRLPGWMTPSTWHYLDRLPLTPGGKVDRSRLAATAGDTPPVDAAGSRSDRRRPVLDDPIAQQVCEIWQRVLELPEIDPNAAFFDLGGTSLLATRIQADLRAELGVELPLHALLANPTVAGLAPLITEVHSATADPVPALQRHDGDRRTAPLSVMQEQIWYFEQLTPGNVAYNAPTTMRLSGPVDPVVLERALTEVVRRHEVLRTTVEVRDGEPVQVIHPPYPVQLVTRDLRELADPGAEAERIVAAEIRVPFDVSQLPLLRWTLLRLADEEYELILVEHHIIHDGWSFALLMQELFANYAAVAGWAPVPGEPKLQYADFAHWQRRALTGSTLNRQLTYWTRQLAGAPDQLDLPYDFDRSDPDQAVGSAHRTELPADLCAAVREFSRKQGTTLFTTMLAAYAATLSRFAGQDELCIGSAYGNRAVPGTHDILGMFVNPVVLRCAVPPADSFAALVDRMRAVTLDAQAHQDLPFVRLVRELAPVRRPGHNPLFAAMLNFDDAPLAPLCAGPISATYLERQNGTAKLDLSVLVVPRAERQLGIPADERDQRITMIWEYRCDLFKPATIRRFAEGFEALLRAALLNPHRRIDELPVGQPAIPPPAPPVGPASVDLPVHLMFAGQVAASGAAEAVRDPEVGGISYAELNRRANRMAHLLRREGVVTESIVAICLPRSVDFVVAVLATLKAGAAYLPLDPASPPDRLGSLLADARPRVLVTNRRLPSAVVDGVLSFAPDDPRLTTAPDSDPGVPVDPDQLAYLIYTSGSTGKPKAVGISHRALGRKYRAWQSTYGLDRHPGTHLQVASVAFDVCTGDLVRALLSGGRLVLCPPDAVLDPAALLSVIRTYGVDCVELLPSVMGLLAGHLAATGDQLDTLRLIAIGGEPWTAADHRRFRAVLGTETRILNVYGVTEVTIGNTYRELSSDGPVADDRPLPIGEPLPDVQAQVLDRAGLVTPIGVVGEIFLGGVGVARGYHGRPDLTAERFVPDRAGGSPGARSYATGDRGRYLPDGGIEFLGRNDHQVKIRGFRVEPGEAENALRSHPAVRDAVVIARVGSTGARLDAYVTARGSENSVGPIELRDFLRGRLPAYLVPSSFRVLAELPRTTSGKIDHRALPEPEAAQAEARADLQPPRSEMERRVTEVWREVLGVPHIGVDDDFFDLGGHSLLAAKVIARLHAALGVRLPVRELLMVPTVAGVSRRIAEVSRRPGGDDRAPALVPRSRAAYVLDAAAFDEPDAGRAGNEPGLRR